MYTIIEVLYYKPFGDCVAFWLKKVSIYLLIAQFISLFPIIWKSEEQLLYLIWKKLDNNSIRNNTLLKIIQYVLYVLYKLTKSSAELQLKPTRDKSQRN